jgi:glycosyltransferase involved in cell wall biosynthesis
MRFFFISTMRGAQWGGSEELWSQAAIQLKLEGHTVRASVLDHKTLSGKFALLAQHGIGLETHPSPSYMIGEAQHFWNRISLSYRRTYRRLRRFNPNLVVISQGYVLEEYEWARICRELGLPYVIVVQCNSELFWFGKHLSEAVANYTGARKVFCVSQRNLDQLRLQVGEPLSNLEVVWNPYNVSPESAPPWPTENGCWRLACVARMDSAAKGQDVLLQVLARPEWRDRPVELNFFGTGPDEPALRRLAVMLQVNNAHFHGHVNDIRAIWEKHHVLVLPSRHEGLPLALVEAMWCGRLAIVTDVGGNAELCVDGETGFVAPAATISCLGHALQVAWDRRKDWVNMGQAARARVESRIPRNPIGLFCERLKASVT